MRNILPVVIIHYSEIALKGKNRSFFEKKLIINLQRTANHFPGVKIRKLHDRVLLALPDFCSDVTEHQNKNLVDRLQKVFGVANFGVGWQVPAEWTKKDFKGARVQEFLEQVGRLMAEKLKANGASRTKEVKSFKLETRRSDKRFPLTSSQVNQRLGEILASQLGKKVDLKTPDLTVFIEITQAGGFFYWQKFKGPGGLPVSSSGKVLALLSGGIDSPVAAWYLMRRGAKVDFVHFHSYPFTSKRSLENVKKIAKRLSDWQGPAALYAVPLADIQKRIAAAGAPKLMLLLYRRAMLRLAQEIAEKQGHKALVTGESLGQVASQTLENLRAVESAVNLPVLRPLIGFDKQEIIKKAKQIGTYEISIQPYEDCCSLFVPSHPETRATEEQLQDAEENIDFGDSLEQALGAMEVSVLY